jgi:hypothetical protein
MHLILHDRLVFVRYVCVTCVIRTVKPCLDNLFDVQKSVCSAFGASIGHDCAIDVGSMKTSISCVEEGPVLAETRMSLDYDVSELYWSESACHIAQKTRVPTIGQ